MAEGGAGGVSMMGVPCKWVCERRAWVMAEALVQEEASSPRGLGLLGHLDSLGQ